MMQIISIEHEPDVNSKIYIINNDALNPNAPKDTPWPISTSETVVGIDHRNVHGIQNRRAIWSQCCVEGSKGR